MVALNALARELGFVIFMAAIDVAGGTAVGKDVAWVASDEPASVSVQVMSGAVCTLLVGAVIGEPVTSDEVDVDVVEASNSVDGSPFEPYAS